MSNQEILEKAILRARSNGYKPLYSSSQIPELNFEEVYGIIFNHEFAKALWGEKLYLLTTRFTGFDGTLERETKIRHWQYHLQQMVISENPIEYLGEHLPD